MSNFTTTALANENFLVEGTDVRGKYGECIIDGGEWLAIKRALGTDTAKAELDAAIEEVFKPFVEAADAFATAKAPVVDALSVVVLDEGTTGEPAREREVVVLGQSSQILRAIEEGATDRLLWVDGSLVITAAPAEVPVPDVVENNPPF